MTNKELTAKVEELESRMSESRLDRSIRTLEENIESSMNSGCGDYPRALARDVLRQYKMYRDYGP